MDETPTIKCPNCGQIGFMIMSKHVKYALLFWIPIVPFDSYRMCQCDNCDRILTYAEMPYTTQQDYDQFEATASFPLWSYTGGIVITVSIAWMILSEILSMSD